MIADRTFIRVNGRGVSRTLVHASEGELDITTENGTAPDSEPTEPGPDPESPLEEVRAMSDSKHAPLTPKQRIAVDYLGRAKRDLENAARARIQYIALARSYGLTNAAIGAELGTSEGAVRKLLARNLDIAAEPGDA